MNKPDFTRRADCIEAMDRPDCDPATLRATVRRFEQTNFLFTRYRTLLKRHILADMRRQPERKYRLTDLGAGGCDIARWLVRACRQEKLALTIRAIEQDPRIARYARQANAGYPEIEVVETDACDPACWGTPDYVFAQHFLHHLPDPDCLRLFHALDQAPLRQFVVSDLQRSRLAYNTYRLIARPLSQGTFILEDGAISIRRGFLEDELRHLVTEAGMKVPVTIYPLFPARLVVIRKSPHPGPLPKTGEGVEILGQFSPSPACGRVRMRRLVSSVNGV